MSRRRRVLPCSSHDIEVWTFHATQASAARALEHGVGAISSDGTIFLCCRNFSITFPHKFVKSHMSLVLAEVQIALDGNGMPYQP